MPKKLVLICLINFFIAAILGLLLRYAFVQPIEINYRFLTHAHSHIAMLGWVYLMLYTFIVHYFIPDKKPVYNRLFWLTEFAVIGMLLSFPFQGYAVVSITFSTLHIFCSYYFTYLIFKHHHTKNKAVGLLLKTALVFMLVSTIGVWCLGPAVSALGQTSSFYQIAIQFFLHFQFNGWFLLAILAVLFHKLQIQNTQQFRLFYKYLIAATVLTFALAIYWFESHYILYWVNSLGVISQFIALYYFIIIVKPTIKKAIKTQASITKYIYTFAIVCFVFKCIIQSITLIPDISNLLYQHRNFVIGFIHLSMLGVITGFLFAILLHDCFIKHTKILKFGIYSFVLGFIVTELLLVYQGFLFYFGIGMMPHYYLTLFVSSIFLPLGIGCLIYNLLKTKENDPKTT